MSYLVLARKWRPVTFGDVIYQRHITQTLENAILSGRIAHAYLFSGPRGIGKTTTARILSKALNCQNGPTSHPCNTCINCTEITEGRSMDVMEIDGASNRGIDEIRNIRENVRYMPIRGKYRIYIIDEVHMLTDPAFNALLKTLEEPPAHVVFIFATTEPHKLPSTILSRCQRFDFRPIPIEEIQRRLTYICSSEKIGIDDESVYMIAKRGDGSMRDALSFLDQAVSFCGDSITKDKIQQVFGIVNQDLFFQITDAIVQKSTKAGVYLAHEIINAGYDLKDFLSGLIEHLRNLLIVRVTGDSTLVEETENVRQRFEKLAPSFKEEDILRLISLATEAFYSIKKGGKSLITMELALIKMIKMDQSIQLSEIIQKLDAAMSISGKFIEQQGSAKIKKTFEFSPEPASDVVRETANMYDVLSSKAIQSSPVNKVIPQDNSKTETGSAKSENSLFDIGEIRKKWGEVLDVFKKKNSPLSSLLQDVQLASRNGSTLEIIFPNNPDGNSHYHEAIRNQILVHEAIKKVFHIPIRLSLQLNGTKTSEPAQPTGGIIESTVQQVESRHPIIGEIINMFDAKVVDYQQNSQSTTLGEKHDE